MCDKNSRLEFVFPLFIEILKKSKTLQGCVNVLVIPNTTLAFRKWKQEAKVDGVPTANIEKVIKSSL
jgi:hypothetical protein